MIGRLAWYALTCDHCLSRAMGTLRPVRRLKIKALCATINYASPASHAAKGETKQKENDEYKGKECYRLAQWAPWNSIQARRAPHTSSCIILAISKVQYFDWLDSRGKIWNLYYFVDMTWQLNSLVVRVILFWLKGFHCQRCAQILHQFCWPNLSTWTWCLLHKIGMKKRLDEEIFPTP